MTTAAESTTISKKAAYLRLAMVSFVAMALAAVGIGVLYLEAPVRGETCSAEHATTQDAIGHSLTCNPRMSGSGELVWEYTSESELEAQNERS